MNIKNYVWLLPFCSFILGYYVTLLMFPAVTIPTPHIIGKYIHEIVPIISEHKLNLRLIDQKEEADIPEGIIISQTPQPGKAIKQHQPLFVVTTKKPPSLKAPFCVEKNIDSLSKELHTAGVHPRIYTLPHHYPAHICFAQYPEPEEYLEKSRLTLYISKEQKKPIIWPDFTGLSLETVHNFLDNYAIKPYIINDSPSYEPVSTYTIIDQRPTAGTLVTLDENNPLSIQLRIR